MLRDRKTAWSLEAPCHHGCVHALYMRLPSSRTAARRFALFSFSCRRRPSLLVTLSYRAMSNAGEVTVDAAAEFSFHLRVCSVFLRGARAEERLGAPTAS